ncbi:leucine-rich repeat-containing protein 75A [Gracilinanus agilis]|uniref:leucine-rich repeat-containing protein 75A n=1 Tax=Gracilinanus agilis TaxID=191870 RepID=UPI001CFE54D9|nr:leucine-rich repeat-containing protein 75A [Gracilinanus agilis]
MGTRQTKGSLAESPGAPPAAAATATAAPRRRSSARERGDLWAALLLRSGDKAARAGAGAGAGLPPYHRRVGMIQELLALVRQGRQDEAGELLRNLRQDLGMESTSLDDVLYRYASFRNLVDPITHDLIISLARYVHCPKPEGDALGTMEKLCRQLMYHLSPHSQWKRQGLVKRKPQTLTTLLSWNQYTALILPAGRSGSSCLRSSIAFEPRAWRVCQHARGSGSEGSHESGRRGPVSTLYRRAEEGDAGIPWAGRMEGVKARESTWEGVGAGTRAAPQTWAKVQVGKFYSEDRQNLGDGANLKAARRGVDGAREE